MIKDFGLFSMLTASLIAIVDVNAYKLYLLIFIIGALLFLSERKR